jgi:hypothetical protein
MRYVEAVEWLTSERISVSGSVNPSTTEYSVFDVANKKLESQFFDDGHGAAFSPDGNHVAYVSGGPHFTPQSGRVLTLNVDGKAVFVEAGGRGEFIDAPRWSADSNSVAVMIADFHMAERRIVLHNRAEMTASAATVPHSTGTAVSVRWSANDLYVESASEAWVLRNGHLPGPWTQVEGLPPDTLAAAETAKARLTAAAYADGGREADVWCNDCALTVLPRRSADK